MKKTTPRRYAVVGGKALGEGTFGCVLPVNDALRSAGRCTDIDYSKYKVSKIFVSPDHAEEELQQSYKLSDIKGIDEFAILPKDICSFTLSQIKDQDAKNALIRDCERLNPINLSNSGSDGEHEYLAQLFYSEQGTTLSEFWKSQTSIDINLLLGHFLNLSKGLEIFVENELLHKDIKPGNIIVPNDNSQKAKYIDFGYLTDFTEFAWYFDKHEVPYRYWAPELYTNIPSGRDFTSARNTAYENLKGDIKDPKEYIRRMFKIKDSTPSNMINTILDSAETDVNNLPTPPLMDQRWAFTKIEGRRDPLMKKDVGKSIYKNAFLPFLSKIDMYSLGLTFQEILAIVVTKIQPSESRIQTLQALAIEMSSDNPSQRPSASDLTMKLTALMPGTMGGKRRPPSKTKAQSTPKTKANTKGSSKAKAPTRPKTPARSSKVSTKR